MDSKRMAVYSLVLVVMDLKLTYFWQLGTMQLIDHIYIKTFAI